MLGVEIAQGRTKPDLLALAHTAGVEVRDSWPKARIAEAIAAAGVDVGPADLDQTGQALWLAVAGWLTEQQAALDPHERALVAELCRTADRLATIRGALRTVEPTEPAWARLASEERQRGLAMTRLISAAGLPTGLIDENGNGDTSKSRRAQKAARARWNKGPGPGQQHLTAVR